MTPRVDLPVDTTDVDALLAPLRPGDTIQHVMSMLLQDDGLNVVMLKLEAGFCDYHNIVEIQATIGNNGTAGGDDVHQ